MKIRSPFYKKLDGVITHLIEAVVVNKDMVELVKDQGLEHPPLIPDR